MVGVVQLLIVDFVTVPFRRARHPVFNMLPDVGLVIPTSGAVVSVTMTMLLVSAMLLGILKLVKGLVAWSAIVPDTDTAVKSVDSSPASTM